MQEIDPKLTKLRFENPIIHSALCTYEKLNGKLTEKDTLIKIISMLSEIDKEKTNQITKLHNESSLPKNVYGILSQTKMPDGSIDTITRHKITTKMIAISINGGAPSYYDETEFIMK